VNDVVNNNKSPSVQAAPVGSPMRKPVRKAPPPPIFDKTQTTLINGNQDHTPSVSPFNSSDQKALESPVFVDQSSNDNTPERKPLISPKPESINKSFSINEISVGVKVAPKPPERASSLINDVDASERRHSSCEDGKFAKPVPKKRTKSINK